MRNRTESPWQARVLSLMLSLCLLLAMALPVLAEEEEENTLRIVNLQQFLDFAEDCRLDAYSQNLTVTLAVDLDLSGTEFTGIPIFCGTFQGGGHTISGWTFDGDGSQVGLFRYLTDTAVVQDLYLEGDVQPQGSRENVGGLAGSNAGRIENCQFTGTVIGGDGVGGLVGVNTVSGIIENCHVSGDLSGNHFVGGIAGKNNGVIRSCANTAQVNTTVQENTVSLSDVTIDSLTHSESSQTVTDIGGIAGSSDGVIRDCVNRGDVGYQHMGYNIGGIAGTQSGYIVDCENRGSVQGRKEVGGIVGQMEPTARIEYEEDALQILQRQLNGLSGTVSQTSANVQNAAGTLYSQVEALGNHVQDAKDAVGLLIPDRDDPSLPDGDTIQAAKNGLSSSISGMNSTLEGMSASTQSAMGKLSNNLHSLQNQITAMSATLGNVSETLGGSLTDVSDDDTEADLGGKVASCVNYGAVLADRNVGGIAGAMALENDLDLQDDLQSVGQSSLNFESELRAVVLDCENQATVTASKENAGGVVGWVSLGLVKNSRNLGDVDGETCDYVGGVAGQSSGYIRGCSAKSTLTGNAWVGGVAGSATIATDCRSAVALTGTEKLGGILGEQAQDHSEEEIPLSGNFYLPVFDDHGGIDGISYDGLAQPLDEDTFLALEDLPELFAQVIVTFRYDDGTQRQITLSSGSALSASQIPQLPERDGYVGRWEGLEEADLDNIVFNITFEASYVGNQTTLESKTTRANGRALLLVEGNFTQDSDLTVAQGQEEPPLEGGQTLAEIWNVHVENPLSITGGRLLLPEDWDADHMALLVRSGDGDWQTVEHTLDGSYAVFSLTQSNATLALVQTASPMWLLYAGVALAVLLAAALLLGFRKKRKSSAKRS